MNAFDTHDLAQLILGVLLDALYAYICLSTYFNAADIIIAVGVPDGPRTVPPDHISPRDALSRSLTNHEGQLVRVGGVW